VVAIEKSYLTTVTDQNTTKLIPRLYVGVSCPEKCTYTIKASFNKHIEISMNTEKYVGFNISESDTTKVFSFKHYKNQSQFFEVYAMSSSAITFDDVFLKVFYNGKIY
jgi:hypothetical protein